MKKKPDKTGKNRVKRDEKGRFVEGESGNPEGRTKGSLSITAKIKEELEKCPPSQDKRTYLELLVKRILNKAIVEGDTQMIRQIWNYIDGLPKESLDLTTKGGKLGIPISVDLSKMSFEELKKWAAKLDAQENEKL